MRDLRLNDRVNGLLVFAVLTGLLATTEARAACSAELPGWGQEVPITVSSTGTALTYGLVRVMVDTTGAIGGGLMRADGGDIRFMETDCSATLGHWIEGGLGTSATAIWVKVPNLPASGSRTVHMFYQKPDASGTGAPAAVFGADLATFYAFNQNGGSTLIDRQSGMNLALSGATATSWGIGPFGWTSSISGFASGGRATRSGTGPAIGAGDFTALSFVRPSNPNGNTEGIFGNYAGDADRGWALKLQGGTGQYMLITNEDGNWCQAAGGSVPGNTWSFVGARRSAGVTNTLLFNGASILNFCSGDRRNVDGPGAFELGHSYGGVYPFNGAISLSFLYHRALPDDEYALLDTNLRVSPPAVDRIGPARAIIPPGAPTLTDVTSADGAGKIAFAPPSSTGSSPILGYEVACSPSGSASGASSPIVVGGLTNGDAYTCAVRARSTDGAGPWSADSVFFTPGGGVPSITSAATATFTVKSAGSFAIATTGAPAPAVSVAGALPNGLSFANGVIQGTPAAGSVGTYSLSVTANNGVLPSATQTLTLEVVKAAQSISVAEVPTQQLGSQPFVLDASASSNLLVTVESATPAVCAVSGLVVSLVAAGQCTLAISQVGNEDFEAALRVTTRFRVVNGPGDATEPDGSVPTADASAADGSSSTGDNVGSSGRPPPADRVTASTPLSTAVVEGGGGGCGASGAAPSMTGLALGVMGIAATLARRRRRP